MVDFTEFVHFVLTCWCVSLLSIQPPPLLCSQEGQRVRGGWCWWRWGWCWHCRCRTLLPPPAVKSRTRICCGARHRRSHLFHFLLWYWCEVGGGGGGRWWRWTGCSGQRGLQPAAQRERPERWSWNKADTLLCHRCSQPPAFGFMWKSSFTASRKLRRSWRTADRHLRTGRCSSQHLDTQSWWRWEEDRSQTTCDLQDWNVPLRCACVSSVCRVWGWNKHIVL